VCAVLGEPVKSWVDAKKILSNPTLQSQMLGKLEEMADAATLDVPLDADAREHVLQLMQDVDADTILQVKQPCLHFSCHVSVSFVLWLVSCSLHHHQNVQSGVPEHHSVV
jgi:hypothetical protein